MGESSINSLHFCVKKLRKQQNPECDNTQSNILGLAVWSSYEIYGVGAYSLL